jgi:dTDP-4-dehydrorhamnose reductase
MSSVATQTEEFLAPEEMLKMVIDWTGGCTVTPGNADVLEALLDVGVEKERLLLLAHALAKGVWSRYAAANLVLEMLSARRVRAAIARHGHLHHGLRLDEARRDVRTMHSEARELVQREILLTVKEGQGVSM